MTGPLGQKNGNIYSSKMPEYILREVFEMTVTCHIRVPMTKKVIMTIQPKHHDLVGTIPGVLGYDWVVVNGKFQVGSLNDPVMTLAFWPEVGHRLSRSTN